MGAASRAIFALALGFVAIAAQSPPMPRLAGDAGRIEQGTSLYAREADSRLVLWMLGHDGRESFVAIGGAPLTGVATAANRAALFDALSSGRGATVVRAKPGASTKLVTIDEPAIPSRDLVARLAKAADAKGVAIAHDAQGGELSVSLRGVPVDAALATFGAATGTRVLRGRDLYFVVPADQALAELPKKAGAAFELHAAGASASQIVALLEAAGIAVDGRVPCEPRSPVWLDAASVSVDEAMRAVRLIAGADQIGNADACAPKTWSASGSPSLAGATPIAVVRPSSKTREVALVTIGGEAWLVSRSAIAKGTRLVSGATVVLGAEKPVKPALDVALAAWNAPAAPSRTVTRGLAAAGIEKPAVKATVVGPRRREALLEDRAGAAFVVTGDDRSVEIGDGTIAVAVAPASPPPQLPKETGGAGEKGIKKVDELMVHDGGVTKPPEAETPNTKNTKSTSTDSSSRTAPPNTGGKKVDSTSNGPVVPSSALGEANGPSGGGAPKDVPAPDEFDAPETDSAGARGKRGLSASSASGPLWAVEPFGEKAGWLAAQPASLAARYRGDSWGDTFALALETALRERGTRAHAVGKKLTEAEIRTLAEKEALRFILGGEIRTLALGADKVATLTVSVKVRKESGGTAKTVDLRSHSGSTKIAGSVATEGELLELVRATAGTAAEAVVVSLPQDLFAVRN